MSKTDKTAPWRVKFHYEPHFLEEHHDHRFHDCNLPPRPGPKDEVTWYGKDDRPCFWWVSFAFYRSRWARCGCWMCGRDAGENITLRKRLRIEGKKYCQDGWRDEY